MRVILLLLMAGAALCIPASALAFQEPNDLPGVPAPAECLDCHFNYQDFIDDCRACHANNIEDGTPGFEFYEPSGPHSGYMATTNKCAVCHSVHAGPADGVLLLPAATLHDTCFTCHDGTGGWGVYGALAARSVPVGGGHGYNETNEVPGGDPSTGGASTVTFQGAGGTLICNDCHSVHGNDVVNPFVGDRFRMRQSVPTYSSAKLLRRSPTGADAAVDDYGSDWCLTCHKGRDSESMAVHNHPVDTVASASPLAPFTYANVARLISNDPTGETEWGALGGITTRGDNHAGYDPQIGADNRGFLMPYPRTTGAGGQSGHAPICQQCHEDSRVVGQLETTGTIADAAPAVIAYADSVTWNGSAWVTASTDNPRFQNFPHETENDSMLVESYDNLCLNCHPMAQLP